MPWPPIQNLDQIDLLAPRHDGGVDLIIVASSRMDGSPEHQKLLLDKIQGYMAYVNSAEFKAEFGNPPADKVEIVVSYKHEPHPAMLMLLEKCKPWIEKNNARLRIDASVGEK
jgi:hypothetical protein